MIWDNFQNLLVNSLFGISLITTILYWFSLAIPEIWFFSKTSVIGSIFINFIILGILTTRWIISGYFPLSNLYKSLLFLTWCLSTIQIFGEYKTNSKIMGSLICPICLLLIGFSTLILPVEMQKITPLVPALQSNWLMLHVSMMMLSYATLILGALFSTLFLLIVYLANWSKTKEINNQQILTTNVNSLPQHKINLLNKLDRWSYRTIGIGFPFLTMGIISGAVWANEAWGSYWSWDPKETWALITWIIFASYLHARLTKNWQGEKTAWLGTFGFFIIWICYLGVNFLGKGLHSYGWIS